MSAITPPPAKSPALWIAAIRPQFLTITAVAVLIGLAASHADGLAFDGSGALAALLGALLAHAGANVVNDYHDRDADAGNVERLYPFTGGSRMIQDGLFTPQAMATYGYALLGATVLLGAALALDGRPDLWTVGVIGLALAIAYSAPPLRLSACGIGEFVIAGAWLLVVIGADMVQRGAWSLTPFAAGLPIALLVAAILHANEFPDRSSDAAAGKNTIVVKLGPTPAAWAYFALVLAAYAGLALAVIADVLPFPALLGLLAAPMSFFAAAQLIRHAATPPTTRLLPAVKTTILAAHVHGLLVAGGLMLA